MEDSYNITLNTTHITMSSYGSNVIKGLLTKNGLGFKGSIGFIYAMAGNVVAVENYDNIFSSENGEFEFTIDSAYFDNGKHGSGVQPSIYRNIHVLYCLENYGKVAEAVLAVIVKPTPI